MLYETKFLVSLGFTLAIEVPLVVVLMRYFVKLREVSFWKVSFVAFLASVVTLPYLWFVIGSYVDARFYLLIGESFVVLFEMLIFNQLLGVQIHKAFTVSLVVNFVSYFLGGLLLKLF
ncbi:MAG: hypothetical protein ABID64_02670 [Nitrospirota bacterium]